MFRPKIYDHTNTIWIKGAYTKIADNDFSNFLKQITDVQKMRGGHMDKKK